MSTVNNCTPVGRAAVVTRFRSLPRAKAITELEDATLLRVRGAGAAGLRDVGENFGIACVFYL